MTASTTPSVKTTLARTLRTTEYFTLAFGVMIGVGWLVTCVAFTRSRVLQPGDPRAKRREIGVARAGAAVAVALLLLKLLPFIPGSFRLMEYLSLGAWLALGALLRRRPHTAPAPDVSAP